MSTLIYVIIGWIIGTFVSLFAEEVNHLKRERNMMGWENLNLLQVYYKLKKI